MPVIWVCWAILWIGVAFLHIIAALCAIDASLITVVIVLLAHIHIVLCLSLHCAIANILRIHALHNAGSARLSSWCNVLVSVCGT